MEDMYWVGAKFFEYFKGVAPLAVVLVLVRVLVLGGSMESTKQFIIAVLLATVGLALFVEACQISLVNVGGKVGEELINVSRPVMLIVAFAIGFAATLVEPALIVTANTAAEQTAGAISPTVLKGVVAMGVAFGMVLGVGKIVYGISTMQIMIPLLILVVVLVYFAGDTFAGLAWDCASATTGPVNIPVNLAIAIGLASRLGLDPMKAGFGIVGFTCLGAAMAVLIYGITAGRSAFSALS